MNEDGPYDRPGFPDPGIGFYIQSNNDNSAPFGPLQNYPNPFNPETTITYMLPFPGPVTLILYDMLGREAAIWWIDPLTGARTRIGNFPAYGTQSFVRPEGWEDAVLLVEKEN
jgi:hypothetical protein